MTTGDAIPTSGRIDLHSHLLPEVDDGCTSVDEAMGSIRALMERGFIGSVCTPHVWREQYPDNHPETIAAAVEALRRRLLAEGLDYALWPGGEVRVGRSTIPWFEQSGVPTLGGGNAVQIDYWGTHWPNFAEEVCDWLLARGYTVVLAHPERMDFPFDDLDGVVERLTARGVLLQGNLNSIGGGEGATAAEVSRRFLAAGKYAALASDTHGLRGLASRFAGLDWIEANVAQEEIVALIENAPRLLLSGQAPRQNTT